LPAGRNPRSVRIRVASEGVMLEDPIQGQYCQDLVRDIGDFVIQRADGIIAYQLATVIDDAAQGVSEVVRGADLLSSTPRQIWLQRQLELARPAYVHIPVLVDQNGAKFGKSSGALPLDPTRRSAQLCKCLHLLGQAPPHALTARPVKQVLRWAVDNWSLQCVPKQLSLPLDQP
jgi:glutamyl-Q tRNA(Asp) synthetase